MQIAAIKRKGLLGCDFCISVFWGLKKCKKVKVTDEVNVKKRVRKRKFTGDAVVGGVRVSVVHDE